MIDLDCGAANLIQVLHYPVLKLQCSLVSFTESLMLLTTSCSKALQQLREKALRRASITEERVLQKIEERTAARKAKQYEKSDEIRKELAAVGIALMDGPDGTTWRPSVPLSEEEAEVVKT
jgi:cysteinyl-tRNA synthetase